ncbi:MAG TPA: methionyl-tRNA formyltransferase [Gaiellaceae bacterium]|nr:methionyl-tRNA formyltransferase [Gaiellaceae bacterium]
MSRPIAVAATAAFGADVLERLAARHEISAVLTRPDARAGRGRKLSAAPAKTAALRLGLRVLEPERIEPGLELGAEVVVAVAYGLIVPQPALEERLWLNVHPSLLPRWRGAAPVERALMAGDAETGVTVIRLVKELDAGPIAAQERFAIESDDDAGAVYARSAEVAVRLLDDVLAEPEPAFREQAGEATYAHKITAEDRRLDLDRPARELVNQVRALSPHIGARAELHGRAVTVWEARVGEDGSFEPVEVQPDGKARMTYDAWLRGLRR